MKERELKKTGKMEVIIHSEIFFCLYDIEHFAALIQIIVIGRKFLTYFINIL